MRWLESLACEGWLACLSFGYGNGGLLENEGVLFDLLVFVNSLACESGLSA
jgi:hypothetical protein